jgi:hypothetical protein
MQRHIPPKAPFTLLVPLIIMILILILIPQAENRKKYQNQRLPSRRAGANLPNYFSDAVVAAGGNHVAPRRHDLTKLWQSEFA